MLAQKGLPRGRFVFIDALRGVAAFAVVMHHAFLKTALMGALVTLLPWHARMLLRNLSTGVEVFFVLSGFVIAHSLRDTPITPRGCGRFMLRRQLRLDPPYWVMLGLVCLLGLVSAPLGVAEQFPAHHASTLFSNVFYLEKILHRYDILEVGWTLAMEIQFYLAFITILAIGTRGGRDNSSGPTYLTLAVLLISASVAAALGPNASYQDSWGIHAWPFFASGVLCYWALQRQVWGGWMGLLLVLLAAMELHYGWTPQVVVGIGTTLAIYVVGWQGRLGTLGSNRPIQFLGRISYSLYLVHLPIVVLVGAMLHRLTGDRRAAAAVWYWASIAIAILVAYGYYRLLEAPSMQLAARFKGRRAQGDAELVALSNG